MEKLKDEVRKYQLIHKKVKESDQGYIYEVFSQGAPSGYDVFKKKIGKGKTATIDGREVVFRESERYPNDNAFGTWAFHFMALDKAEARLESFGEAK